MSEVLHLRPCSWAVQELFSRIWVISRSIFITGNLKICCGELSMLQVMCSKARPHT